jgi:hypothetical protein
MLINFMLHYGLGVMAFIPLGGRVGDADRVTYITPAVVIGAAFTILQWLFIAVMAGLLG